MLLRILLAGLALPGSSLLGGHLLAAAARAAEDPGAAEPGCARIELLVRAGCPHCERAESWVADLRRRRPDVAITIRDVMEDPAARERLMSLSRAHRVSRPGVPTIEVCGDLFVGFDRPATSGAAIERRLAPAGPADLPSQRAAAGAGARSAAGAGVDSGSGSIAGAPSGSASGEAGGEAPAAGHASTAPPRATGRVHLPWLGDTEAAALGLPLFTVAVALVDGFNPCATWVLLFLLSLLVNMGDRRKILVVAGTFVLVSGLAYLAFMAAWLNVFVLVGFSRPAQIVVAVAALAIGALHLKEFAAFGRGPSLSIPGAARPGLYARMRAVVTAPSLAAALGAAIVLAVLVNLVELLCTAGLPAVYTQVLALHDLPAWERYAYLVLYNVIYMLDDAVILAVVVVTLRRFKLQERGGRWLKLTSGALIFTLGAVLLLAPERLV